MALSSGAVGDVVSSILLVSLVATVALRDHGHSTDEPPKFRNP